MFYIKHKSTKFQPLCLTIRKRRRRRGKKKKEEEKNKKKKKKKEEEKNNKKKKKKEEEKNKKKKKKKEEEKNKKKKLKKNRCVACGLTFNKDDLNATNCTRCKRCPLCKLVVTMPNEEEGDSAEVKAKVLRRCHGCKAKFGGYLLSETVHRNILKVRNLIEHYSSHEFRGSGDHNLVNYWSCQVPSHLAVSEAQEVTSLDNCVEFICRSEFDINCSAPPKQRMQMPCQQYQLTCQLAPVPLLLQPRYTYYCKRCHNMVLTTSS
ncbi:hypothetical protein M8J75_011183 [Diaphorina citri]|nr:hypothetical protein M8J75_011183 [Diaphorina citri]